MLQLVLVSSPTNMELSLPDLALIHTTSLANSHPDDDMNWLAEIVFSHHIVIFDTETR